MPPKPPEDYWRYVRRCEHCGERTTYVSCKRSECEWLRFVEIAQLSDGWATCSHCKLWTLQTVVATDNEPE